MKFIPWSLRNDLPFLYGIFYFCENSLDWFNKSRWGKAVFPVGKIPDKFFSQVKKRLIPVLIEKFEAWVPDEVYSWENTPYSLELYQFDELSEDNQIEALEQNKSCFWWSKIVRNAVDGIEALDKYKTENEQNVERVPMVANRRLTQKTCVLEFEDVYKFCDVVVRDKGVFYLGEIPAVLIPSIESKIRYSQTMVLELFRQFCWQNEIPQNSQTWYNIIPVEEYSGSLQIRFIPEKSAFWKEFHSIIESLNLLQFEAVSGAEYDNAKHEQIDNSAPVSIEPVRAESPIYNHPQIYAKGEEKETDFGGDSFAASMVTAGNTARTAEDVEEIKGSVKKIENLLTGFVEGVQSIKEDIHSTKNATESMNMKIQGRITKIEDIPPYIKGDSCWVTQSEYANMMNIKMSSLQSLRSDSEGKNEEKTAGIHGGKHVWRAVGKGTERRIYYYVYH